MRFKLMRSAILAASWFFLSLLLTAPMAGADGVKGHPGEETKTLQGIEAVLKADVSRSMVDLYLKDAKTGKPVVDAKAQALVKLPSGREILKDLMGMTMGGEFSYMATLEMSEKGVYVFDITVSHAGKNVVFRFSREVE